MKFTYPAVIKEQEDGKWLARVPDLACCEAIGDSLDEAIERVNEAVYDWIYLELTEDDGQLPAISEEEDLDPQHEGIVRNICVNIRFTDGWDE